MVVSKMMIVKGSVLIIVMVCSVFKFLVSNSMEVIIFLSEV